ncbi:PREDICTED: uncharacterized protein LOC18604754 [Theobroma cacao]|uniref:Uncharacterized protein LOC18604754 n=1 Tax=Theobroma cacao TaxID=3641 RepID=A0AB32V9I0_THECC|nr:PREDICTED: uncharacterized protein LOC18604754 [Theobroma cacao]
MCWGQTTCHLPCFLSLGAALSSSLFLLQATKMLENDRILEGFLFGWEKFHSINHKQPSKPKPNPQIKQQWSMVMIRDSLPHDDLSIFPPVDHENLPNQIQQQHNPPSSSTLSPPRPGASEVIPASAGGGIGEWLGIGLEILRAKMVSIACYFGYKNGTMGRAFGSLGRVIGVAVAAVLWWLCRRRTCRKESVEQLKRSIKEKDEKIRGLLNQIAEMNQLLVARHKALASNRTHL